MQKSLNADVKFASSRLEPILVPAWGSSGPHGQRAMPAFSRSRLIMMYSFHSIILIRAWKLGDVKKREMDVGSLLL